MEEEAKHDVYNVFFNLYRTADKRGYNPLKVEDLVDLPLISSDPTDPLFQHQWYLVNQIKQLLQLRRDVHPIMFIYFHRKMSVRMVENPNWT